MPERNQVNPERLSLNHIKLPSPRLSVVVLDPPGKAYPRETYFTHELLDITPNLYSEGVTANTTFKQNKFDLENFKNEPIDMNDVRRRAFNQRGGKTKVINITHLNKTHKRRFVNDK